MTVVIKFAVVGQGIFYDKIIGQGAVSQQLAVLRGKGGVVFAGASVFIAFAVIDGDIAEDYAQLAAVFRSGDDLVAVSGTVFDEGCLAPTGRLKSSPVLPALAAAGCRCRFGRPYPYGAGSF